MTPLLAGLSLFAALVALVRLGLHVPIALVLCAWAGTWAMKGSEALAAKLLALTALDAISHYHFGVVPLFVLMGQLVAASGMGRDAFDAASALFGRVRGGLAVGTIGANAVFATISGVSIASAAVFARVAVPEMLRHGYRARFAVGLVAGSSVLGMLIPPSLLLILYAILAEQSVGALFVAGLGPGLLLTALFGLGVVLMARFAPGFVGRDLRSAGEHRPGAAFLARRLIPILALLALVLGGIGFGLFTPIEASAVGATAAFAIALARGTLDRRTLVHVLGETATVTANVCFLIIAAQMFARTLALSGLPASLGDWVAAAGIGYWGVLIAYVTFLVALGTVLDAASTILVAVPLMLPLAIGMEFDLVWFGIVTVLAAEVGLLTPPFGLSVFVIESTLNDEAITLGDIFAGAAPFAAIVLVALALVMAFPAIALAPLG